jgi:hypothetical protein
MVAFSFIMLAARFVTCDFGQPHICGQGVSGKSEGSETPIGPTICESGSFCNYDFGVFGECELCPQKLVAEDGSYACFFRGLSMHGRDSCLNLCLNPNFSELVESAAVQAEVPAAARQLSDGSSSVGSSTGSTSSSSESSGGEAMVVGAKVVFELNVEGATLADVERDLAMYKRAIADSLTIDPSRVDITVRTATAAPRRTRRLAGVVLEVTINAETLGSANAIKASIQSPQYIDAKLAVALNQEGVNSAGVNLDASSVQVVEVVPSTSPTSAPTALLPAGDHVDNGNSKDDVRSEFNSLDAKAKVQRTCTAHVTLSSSASPLSPLLFRL